MIDPNYAHPEALVTTEWVASHLTNRIRGLLRATKISCSTAPVTFPAPFISIGGRIFRIRPCETIFRRKPLPSSAARNGITKNTTVIFYGDKSNWWSCYALWAFRLFGHENVKIVDGGRDKWIAENRPLTREVPSYPRTEYPVPAKRIDDEIRAFYEETLKQSQEKKPLIDVRSPGEFKGEITHMPEYPQEGVLRGGHVPGAKSFPWKRAANDDATFKSAEH